MTASGGEQPGPAALHQVDRELAEGHGVGDRGGARHGGHGQGQAVAEQPTQAQQHQAGAGQHVAEGQGQEDDEGHHRNPQAPPAARAIVPPGLPARAQPAVGQGVEPGQAMQAAARPEFVQGEAAQGTGQGHALVAACPVPAERHDEEADEPARPAHRDEGKQRKHHHQHRQRGLAVKVQQLGQREPQRRGFIRIVRAAQAVRAPQPFLADGGAAQTSGEAVVHGAR